MIPRVIHSCWFGPNNFAPINERCLESWREFLGDYEIAVWRESDINIDDAYFKALLANKKWAFAADFARFWLLDKYGGIWLDTDMEVIRSLDHFLNSDYFIGQERADTLSCGIIGSAPRHPINKKIIQHLQHRHRDGLGPAPIPGIVQAVFEEMEELSDGCHIYEMDYFYPYNPYDKTKGTKQLMARDLTPRTHAIHHWAGSWIAAENTFGARVKRRLRSFLKNNGH